MYKFSDSSRANLVNIHTDLITLFYEVIKYRDCTVVSGLRTQEEQQELYAQGRTKDGNIITYKDGIERRSKHQEGLAVDVVPYPEMYDVEALRDFGNFVKGVAAVLRGSGVITHDVSWGGDWQWKDYPHWEL